LNEFGGRCGREFRPHPCPARQGIRHGFFTRTGGVSRRNLRQPQRRHRLARCRANVAENAPAWRPALQVQSDRLLTAYQTHSAAVAMANTPWSPDARPHAMPS